MPVRVTIDLETELYEQRRMYAVEEDTKIVPVVRALVASLSDQHANDTMRVTFDEIADK